jgi:hypothetical protein
MRPGKYTLAEDDTTWPYRLACGIARVSGFVDQTGRGTCINSETVEAGVPFGGGSGFVAVKKPSGLDEIKY